MTISIIDLWKKCNIKVVNCITIEDADPQTGSSRTRVVCFIQSENAWCDSGDALCLTKDAARQVAVENFYSLLEKHGFDDTKINNLETRSTSPGFSKKIHSTLVSPRSQRHTVSPGALESLRPQSTEPAPSPTQSPTRRRRNSVLKSFKAVFVRKKSPR